MKTRLKTGAAFVALSFPFGVPAAAQGAGEAGMQSIAVNPAARPAGLAGAHTALGSGISALGINPAGLARESGRVFSGSVRPDMARSGSVAYAFPALGGQWAVGATYTDFDEVVETDENNVAQGTLRPYNLYPAVTYARVLGPRWRVGATARLARETLGDFEGSTPAWGAGFDAGMQYQPVVRGLGFGVAATHVGRQFTGYFEGDSRRPALPGALRGGVFYQPPGRRQATFTADVESPFHGAPALAVGAEYRVIAEWEVRAGTRWNRDDLRNLSGWIDPNSEVVERGGEAARFAGGTTVRVGPVAVDYAAQWWGSLGLVHALTVGWSLPDR